MRKGLYDKAACIVSRGRDGNALRPDRDGALCGQGAVHADQSSLLASQGAARSGAFRVYMDWSAFLTSVAISCGFWGLKAVHPCVMPMV